MRAEADCGGIRFPDETNAPRNVHILPSPQRTSNCVILAHEIQIALKEGHVRSYRRAPLGEANVNRRIIRRNIVSQKDLSRC